MRRRMGFAMVDAILQLGALDIDAVGLSDFGRTEGFLERQVPRWRKQLDSYGTLPGWPGPAAIPELQPVADWLQANCPKRFTPASCTATSTSAT